MDWVGIRILFVFSTQWFCVHLFVELWGIMIWRLSGFGGVHCSVHCSGHWSHHAFWAGMCHVFPGNGRGSTFVLLVYHSLKRQSVLYNLYFDLLFLLFFSINSVFTDWFIRKCEIITIVIIFHKITVKIDVCEKLHYDISFQCRYSVLWHSRNHHEHSVAQYSTSCHILIMISNYTLC